MFFMWKNFIIHNNFYKIKGKLILKIYFKFYVIQIILEKENIYQSKTIEQQNNILRYYT